MPDQMIFREPPPKALALERRRADAGAPADRRIAPPGIFADTTVRVNERAPAI